MNEKIYSFAGRGFNVRPLTVTYPKDPSATIDATSIDGVRHTRNKLWALLKASRFLSTESTS